MPSSKAKTAIAKVLADEGFVTGYELTDIEKKPTLNGYVNLNLTDLLFL